MNFTTPLRRTIAVAALVSSFAGAVGAAGAAQPTRPPRRADARRGAGRADHPPGPRWRRRGGPDDDDAAGRDRSGHDAGADGARGAHPAHAETPTTSPQSGKPPVTTAIGDR